MSSRRARSDAGPTTVLTSVRSFHSFFHQLDHYNTSHYLWVTAGGWDAVDDDRPPQGSRLPAALEDGLEDGDENPEEGEG